MWYTAFINMLSGYIKNDYYIVNFSFLGTGTLLVSWWHKTSSNLLSTNNHNIQERFPWRNWTKNVFRKFDSFSCLDLEYLIYLILLQLTIRSISFVPEMIEINMWYKAFSMINIFPNRISSSSTNCLLACYLLPEVYQFHHFIILFLCIL